MDPGSAHPPLLDLLVQIIVIIAAARIGGRAAGCFAQPRVVGEIVSGTAIGAFLTSGLVPLPGALANMPASAMLGLPGDVIAVVLIAALGAGALTEVLGIYAVFGGFIAGVLLHDHQRFVAAWRRQVGGFVEVFFLPVFFTYTGMRLGVTELDSGGLWSWCAAFVLAAMASKLAACWWAARRSGFSGSAAIAMGFLLNTRGLMELVVLNVGLDLGVIPRSVFTMLVFMAVASTAITCPVLAGVGRAPRSAARGR